MLGNSVATFVGPNIANFAVSLNHAMTARDFSSFFQSSTAMTFAAIGTLPTGLSLSAAGVLSGTPTVQGTYAGIVIRATDVGLNTADSNAFTITVLSTVSADIGGGNLGGPDLSGDAIGGSDISTPEWWVG